MQNLAAPWNFDHQPVNLTRAPSRHYRRNIALGIVELYIVSAGSFGVEALNRPMATEIQRA
jgi:hypothetical protein